MIDYKTVSSINITQLEELFLSVNWSSGKYPEKLKSALEKSDMVFSAWEAGRLIGLLNALSDRSMTAYFPYLLVRPEYQRQGIGKKLVSMALEHYRECARKVLIAYDHAVPFYESCGFKKGEGKLPMDITYLT